MRPPAAAPETIIHVTSRAHGHTGVFWRKVRHSSDLHLRITPAAGPASSPLVQSAPGEPYCRCDPLRWHGDPPDDEETAR